MLIQQHRLRSLGSRFAAVQCGSRVICGVGVLAEEALTLERIGFTPELVVGESVLPASTFGPISDFNANGRLNIHRDQPMETAYRTIEWRWEEWHGRYERQERSRFVDVPYQRYPRTLVPPPGIQLRILTMADGRRVVAGSEMTYTEANKPQILHVINLFLEIFGRCQVLTGDLQEIVRAPLRNLNWTILPPGRRPWPQLRRELDPLLRQAPAGNQTVIAHRLETVNSYEPDFVAVGRAGFAGYVVFGFPARNLYVLESVYTGNATYVFDERWEELSMRTKAEILNEHLATAHK